MARELSLEIRQDGAEPTERALATVEDRLQGVEKAAGKAGDAIDKEGDALKRNTTEADKNARAQSGLDKSLQGAIQSFSRLGTGGIIATVGGALAAASKSALDYAGNVQKSAKAAGVSTTAQQQLAFVAGKNKMTFDQLAGAMFDLDTKLAKGGDRIAGTVKSLGFEINDLMRMSPDERLREVGTALMDIENPAERAEKALALFGQAGRNLLPVFEDLANGAERDAPIMSSAWVSASAEVSEALDDMLSQGMTYGKNLAMWALTWPVYTASIAQGWGQAAAAAAGFSAVPLPQIPGGPTSTLPTTMPGGLTLDPFAPGGIGGQSLSFIEQQLTRDAQAGIRANTPRAGRVLPFVRPELMGESDWNNSAIYKAQWFNSFSGRGFTQPTFAGQLPATQNLNFAPLPGAVTPNTPGGGGFLSGLGGLFKSSYGPGFGGFLSGAAGGIASGIGSLFTAGADKAKGIGSMIGGIAGGFLGPIGSIAGSFLGGKLGGLFGGGEGKKTNRTRDAAIEEQFGSVQNLREAAAAADFDVTKLLSTGKIKDFEAEFQKLNEALAESEADAMRVEDAMQRWGISVEEMGPKFQQTKINDVFKEALDDIRVLTNAGADFNVVAEKMAPQLGAMVHEAIEMGGTVPREMEPILKQMIELDLLTDKNGEKFTDLSEIPFAADLNKDFSELIGKMDQLISRLSGLPNLFGDATDAAGDLANATRNIDVPGGGGGEDAITMSRGGWVGPGGVHYFGAGGFVPRGSDTVPAMLTPGEMVLARDTVKSLAHGGGLSITINGLTVGEGRSRSQMVQEIGRAIVAKMERQGYRFGSRVA